jgi:hypothetical protein
MAKPVVYRWVAADPNAVCLLQDGNVGVPIVLNGTLTTAASPNITGLSSQPPSVAYFDKIARVVSISSLNDLHVNFTITGTYNGSQVSETLLGPNIGTVNTTQVYNTVTSVSVDGPAVGLNIGTGHTGATQWFAANTYATGGFSTTVQVDVDGVIEYSFVATLDDVNAFPEDEISTYILIPTMVDATTTLLESTNIPFRYARIEIISSTGNADIIAAIMQQGIV